MKTVPILLISTCFLLTAKAQDIIIQYGGDEIKANVLEVTQNEIKYKRQDNPDGPIYTINKSFVVMIKYENGAQDVFAEQTNKSNATKNVSDLFMKGQLDAARYYTDYQIAGTLILATSIYFTPALTLIPAVVCSSMRPKEINLGYPNANLFTQPDYYNGYTKKAKKIKQGKVWKNWTIGVSVYVGAFLIFRPLFR